MSEAADPASDPKRPSTSLREELLLPFALLFAIGILFSGVAVFFLRPLMRSPGEVAFFLGLTVVGDMAVVLLFASRTLRRSVLGPVSRMVEDASRIASGDYRSRMREVQAEELRALSTSVNDLADRLIQDQALLAENVRSLDQTNEELVEARDQVVRAARMASVGTLSAGLAHELGNPLGAILAFLDAARHRLPEESDTREILASARSEALRIDGIVRSLLEFSRPDAAEPRAFDGGWVVDRVRGLLEAQSKLDGVTVEWPPEGSSATLQGDPQHMEQILVNLLLNALDVLAGVEGPRIEIALTVEHAEGRPKPIRRENDPPGINYSHRRRVARAPGAPLQIKRSQDTMRLSVRDNGPGVVGEYLESLFDPFFTTKDPGSGTGLGLAISARLAEGLGGTLSVENHPEGGAVFSLTLPIHSE